LLGGRRRRVGCVRIPWEGVGGTECVGNPIQRDVGGSDMKTVWTRGRLGVRGG
jgi:hypothetical protein